jgi:hypothetical protein
VGWYRVTEVREGVGVVESHRGQRGSGAVESHRGQRGNWGGGESQRSEREWGWWRVTEVREVVIENHRGQRGGGREKIKYSVLLSEFRSVTDKTMSNEVTSYCPDIVHL